MVFCLARAAGASLHSYAIAIGNNSPAPNGDASEVNRVLAYADDDAAAFHELLSAVSERAYLLAVLDAETQRLFPESAALSRAPDVAELLSVVAQVQREIERDHARGDQSSVFIFYSGHGVIPANGAPAIALRDAQMDRSFLYDRVLAQLSADYVHVLIDACHAEAIVRPRDPQAESVVVSTAQAERLLVNTTLSRFPRVGAIVASASNTQAHEWSAIRHGIFTYELLSALRGAADVNHDRILEYSELYAFLSAANRGVLDPRARLSVVARAPDADRRAPVMRLADFRKQARLTQIATVSELVEIADERGRALATIHNEPGQAFEMIVPSNERVYVNIGDTEASFRAAPGEEVRFDQLAFSRRSVRPRGALEEAISRGLFASEFGRGYYAGFIDQSQEFVSVPLTRAVRAEHAPAPTPGSTAVQRPSALELDFGVGLSRAVANALGPAESVRLGLRPLGWAAPFAIALEGAHASSSTLHEWRWRASGEIAWRARFGRMQSWLGGVAAGGWITQSQAGSPSRSSGFLGAGPLLGWSVDVTPSVGIWLRAELLGALYRTDNRMGSVALPSALLGASSSFF